MKTLVDINENVLKEAMEVSETATKKETITLALEELIRSRLRQRLKSMAGSGMMETSLSDLKSLRQRRLKIHHSPPLLRGIDGFLLTPSKRSDI
jgi:Arc/MetJ family transcription regulator